MPLKTVAQQWLEQEQGGGGSKPAPHTSFGARAPLAILGIAFVVVALFFLPLLVTQPYANGFLPAVSGGNPAGLRGDKQQQAMNLAYQQQQLFYSMTKDAQDQYQQAMAIQAATQAEYQRRQDAVASQSAATNWVMLQTPMAATQIATDLRIRKMQREAYWEQFTEPLKVLGWPIFVAMCLLLALVGTMYAVYRLVPAKAVQMRMIKEERGERTLYVGDNTIVNTALMHQPVMTQQVDGTMVGSGGAEDPVLQARIAQLAAEVKIVQALPVGSKLPGLKPDTSKKLPELEVIDAQIVKPALLKDIQSSLDDGEEL